MRPPERAILVYAMKLTERPAEMVEADVEALRAAGFSDLQIHDIAQITAMFNYFNRIADGLGIAIDDDPG